MYDNKEPDRYNKTPILKCNCCGDDIFENEKYCLTLEGNIYCQQCYRIDTAEVYDDEPY